MRVRLASFLDSEATVYFVFPFSDSTLSDPTSAATGASWSATRCWRAREVLYLDTESRRGVHRS